MAAEVLAQPERAREEQALVDPPLGDQRHHVVDPADEQPRVHPAGKVARAQAHEHGIRREVGKGKVHGAAGRNAREQPVLTEPAHAARPIALPGTARARGDAPRAQVGLVRLGPFGQPEDVAAVLRVAAPAVAERFHDGEVGLVGVLGDLVAQVAQPR